MFDLFTGAGADAKIAADAPPQVLGGMDPCTSWGSTKSGRLC